MNPRQDVPVPFRTGQEKNGPLTWGQIAIWDVLQWLPADDSSLNALGSCPVPAGRTVDQVREALRVLVERHDSLRTLYRETDGRPVQRVLASGELEVGLYEAEDRAALDVRTAELGEALRSRPFDSAVDLPLRAAVLSCAGQPVAVLLAVSHMALDGWSFRIVRDDLEALLTAGADTVLPPPGQQPLERAAYEASERGRNREAKALDYWARGVRDIPASMLESVRGTDAPDFTWARIESPALALAVRSLAARNGLAPAVVLLAAAGLLLSAYKDEDEAALRTIVSTRFRPESRTLVGAFNQNALFRVDIADEPFGQFLRRAANAAFQSYSYCEYHPRKLESMVAEIAEQRGITPDGYCFFNDARFTLGEQSAAPDPGAAVAMAEGIAKALPETRLGPLEGNQTPKGANFFLFLHDLTDRAVLTLCADRRFLAPRGSADFLGDLERLTTRAAVEEVSVRKLRTDFR
ncbi:condensation domain-containing protein [Streptomyces sp. NPDC092296]|uniref:condensation domain-containing protein n=1 Tax=Streptomyces sp. NPDC092296 TaxID=3366012 RepID=UPI00382F7CEF